MTRIKLKSDMEFLNYLLYKYLGTNSERMQIDKIKLRIIENHGFDVSNHIIAKIENIKARATFPHNQKVRK
jgi:hypothetical protein